MTVTEFLQAAFSNLWVILAAAVLVLVAGWFVSRWLSSFLVARLPLPPEGPWRRLARRGLRLLLLLATVAAAFLVLATQTEIAAFLAASWSATAAFFEWAPVRLVLHFLLVAALSWLTVRLFFWVRAWFLKTARRIEAAEVPPFRGWQFQKLALLSAAQATRFVLLLLRLARYAAAILLLLLYLTAVFSVFPQTRGLVTAVLGGLFQVLDAAWKAFQNYLPNLLILAVIVTVTFYGLKLIRFVFRELEKGTISFAHFHQDWAIPTYQLVRFLVLAIAFIGAFPYLPGSASPAFQGISVFLGLLISLGSSSFISNIVSGVVLTYTRAFRVGDRVKIADTVGDVIEKRLLITRIRTIKNIEITVPNGLVMTSHILNYSTMAQDQGLILHTTVTLGYDIPWRRIHEVLIAAARATPGVLSDPAPFIHQTSLGDFAVSYEVNAYTNQANGMAAVTSALHQNIQDECNRAGIEILSPHYAAVRDGNGSTIPQEYRPRDYRAPAFGVEWRGKGRGG